MLSTQLDFERINKNPWPRANELRVKEKFQDIYIFFKFLGKKEFYRIINKCSVKTIDNLYHAIDFYDFFHKVVNRRSIVLRALLTLFVIEAATFDKKYIDFFSWLVKNRKHIPKLNLLANKNRDELREKIESLYKEYKENYGGLQKFNQLFKRCLDFNEKVELIRSFSFLDENSESFHFCYEKERNCCDYSTCYLLSNNKEIDLCIRKIAKMLYSFRCDFAHFAKLHHFTYHPQRNYESLFIGAYDKKLLKIQLSQKKFEELTRKMIYRYLCLQ